MTKRKRLFAVIISAVVIIAVAVYLIVALDGMGISLSRSISHFLQRAFKPKYPLSFSIGDKGTADSIEGRTVVVSVFADLEHDKWDDELKGEAPDKVLGFVSMATDWISEKAAEYGVSAEYIYDWHEHPELRYDSGKIGESYRIDLRTNDGYNSLWDYINNDIPSEELVNAFDADNILYIVFFNVSGGNSVPAFAKDCFFDTEFQYDMVFFPLQSGGLEMTATTLTHEMLHLYGAPDWYKALESGEELTFGVSADCVDYIRENYPDDIMYRTFDKETLTPFYGDVNGGLSDITAYYVGLLDEAPSAVREYGLDLSTHDPLRQAYGE